MVNDANKDSVAMIVDLRDGARVRAGMKAGVGYCLLWLCSLVLVLDVP